MSRYRCLVTCSAWPYINIKTYYTCSARQYMNITTYYTCTHVHVSSCSAMPNINI